MSALDTIQIDFGHPTKPPITTTLWQLTQWKHALALESKGLKISGGRSVSATLKELIGLKKSMRVATLAQIIADTHADVEAQMRADGSLS